MSQIRPLTARRQPTATLAAGAALVALLLGGCGEKGRREPGNPFIGPSGAESTQPFGAVPVAGRDERVAAR